MSDPLQYYLAIRLACFAGVFAAMGLWEVLAPRRELATMKPWRWASNLGLVLLNNLLLRFIAPFGAVGVALVAENAKWGLFNVVTVPHWIEFLLSVLLLDFAIYLQHVMFHAVPLFWRLHKVHHADLDIDVTTGVRFHTVEILLSLGIKSGVILLLGPPPVAVFVFEVLLTATSMFNHSNVRMPLWLDRVLRWLVVTPDMHRVHHSCHRRETNSNFGFNYPWWDRLLGTYRDQPADGHTGMTIGLSGLRDESKVDRLHWMLWLPFTRNASDYPLNKTTQKRHEQDPTSESTAAEGGSGNGFRKKIILLVLLTTGIIIGYALLSNVLTLDALAHQEGRLREFLQAHPLHSYGIAFLVYVAVTGLSLPGAAVLTLAYGWFFGLVRGVLLVSIASTSGATLAFLLSRYLFQDAVQRRFGDRMNRFNDALEKDGPFFLFTLRLIPAVPFFAINAVMGLTPIRTLTFWWVSQLGMLPGTTVYVYAGSIVPSLQTLADDGIGAVFTTGQLTRLLIAFVLLGLFPLAVRWSLRYFGLTSPSQKVESNGRTSTKS